MNKISHQPQQNFVLSNLPTKLLSVMLWVLIAISIAAMAEELISIFDFRFRNEISIPVGGIPVFGRFFAEVAVLGIAEMVVFIPTAIVFLIWVYRANSNCHKIGADGMRFTPAWSVILYFIPLSNLWWPYHVMKEIWRVSKNPSDWPNETNDFPLLRWWWRMWLFNLLIGALILVWWIFWPIFFCWPLCIADGIITIPLCAITISMIRNIASNQRKWSAPRLSGLS